MGERPRNEGLIGYSDNYGDHCLFMCYYEQCRYHFYSYNRSSCYWECEHFNRGIWTLMVEMKLDDRIIID